MNQPRRGYSLGALFVLVTASAVLIAGVAPLVRSAGEGIQAGKVAAAIGTGLGCGMLVGLIIGFFHFRRGLGVIMGIASGAVIGAAAGAIAMVPANALAMAAAAMTAGSALIVGVAILMRRSES